MRKLAHATWNHLYIESKKAELRETRVECRLPGAGGLGKWEDTGQRVQTSSCHINKFWDLMFSMVITANNTVFYTWKILLEEWILHVLTTKGNSNYVMG